MSLFKAWETRLHSKCGAQRGGSAWCHVWGHFQTFGFNGWSNHTPHCTALQTPLNPRRWVRRRLLDATSEKKKKKVLSNESASCYWTHNECCVVLAPHGLVQGRDAILCSEVQVCASTLQHLDDVSAALQLSRQRHRTFCKICGATMSTRRRRGGRNFCITQKMNKFKEINK